MQSSLGQHLQQTFPSFFHLNHLTYAFEKELQLLQLDEKEIALVTVLLITSIGMFSSYFLLITYCHNDSIV